MPNYGGWEIIRPLGEGGQGQVFLVRSPTRKASREQAQNLMPYVVRQIGGNATDSKETVSQKLLAAIGEYGRPDGPDELGALKQFKFPAEGEEAIRAAERFRNEIKALEMMKGDPAVLRVLQSDSNEHW